MKLLLDQNMRARLGAYLRSLGHDATRVGKDYPAGLADMRILTLARSEGRILLTQDKDFVDLVVRRQLSHAGVVFFQLGNAALPIWIDRLETVLRDHADDLAQQHFLVVTRHDISVRQ